MQNIDYKSNDDESMTSTFAKKTKEAALIAQQTKDFIANGGSIEHLNQFDSANVIKKMTRTTAEQKAMKKRAKKCK